jgi:small subunit ribosomal protein S9
MPKGRKKFVLTKAKKKTAIARVRIKRGRGLVRINGKLLAQMTPDLAKEIIYEPLMLAEDLIGSEFVNSMDITANVQGGGIMGQAQATRTAIGKALVEFGGGEKLRKRFVEYDRSLIVDDVRKKEPKKYLRKGARAKPIKSYR